MKKKRTSIKEDEKEEFKFKFSLSDLFNDYLAKTVEKNRENKEKEDD